MSGIYRWYGLIYGSVLGWLLAYGLPDPPAHRHAHTWALAVAVVLIVQQLFFLLGLLVDAVMDDR